MKRALFFANTERYLYNFRLSLARADTARERVVTPFSLACMADSYCGLWAEVMGQ